MKRLIVLVLFAIILTAGNCRAESKVYGTGVNIEYNTNVSEIMDKPEKFIGKRVKIAGMIVEVCAKRGCWVYLSSDRPFEKIQIKVKDGEIVFPMSASGHFAQVEGVVEELKMSKDEMISYKKHLAEEKGETFDPASVKGDSKIIRLVGKGAVIDF